MSSNNKLKKSIKNLGFGIRGIWLIILYFLIIGFVIVSFSSFQFQDKVIRYSALAPENTKDRTTLGELIEMIEKYQPLRDRLNAAGGRLEGIQTNMTNAEELLAAAEGKLFLAESKVNRSGETLLSQLDYYYTIDNDKEKHPGLPEITEFISINAYRELTKNVGLYEKHEDVKKLLEQYRQARSEYQMADGAWNEAKQVFEHHKRRFNLENEKMDDIQEKLQSFRKNKSERDFELLNELLAFKNISFLVFYLKEPLAIATMPTTILTLIVTLAMGALGSVIFLTTSFFRDRESKPFSWYIFRPFLGMITALAMLVFAKAGQLTITERSIATMQTDALNPFLVSFLAIISGLLSEQAIDRISKTGKGIFNGKKTVEDSKKSRNDKNMLWGYGLAEAFAKQSDKAPSDLAQHLGISEGQITKWAEELESVPFEFQDKIAEWFDLSKQALFTEKSPSER